MKIIGEKINRTIPGVGPAVEARDAYPEVHFTCGLSNIFFGMPAHKFLNRGFLTLCMDAGLDSAVMDRLDAELRAALHATEVLLGRGRHCRRYTRGLRKGLLETRKRN